MPILSLNIPERRKSVLIGKNGSVKKMIEEKTKSKITIGNGVEIEGENPLIAKDIVQAIARGFDSETALLLLDEDNCLEMISLEGERENTRKRLFARVIGKDGKIKKFIENSTDTHITIYGKTVSIIGEWKMVSIARKTVEIVLSGKPFSAMKAFLERELKG
ncbi:MAG: RNA-processing protein [Candidatus Aenigmarchaeota archaeon]|nr:RNA-processing protein [Candidatus Aenigmarchaeota archaeon]